MSSLSTLTLHVLQPVSVLLEAASVFTFFAAFLFVPVVSSFWAWWKDVWGWNIILLESCIWVSLLPAPLHAIFDVPYGSILSWFQVTAVLVTGGVVIWRACLILLTQYHAARQQERGKE